MEQLIAATKSSDWKTRRDAVNTLGELEDPRGMPALAARALYDDNLHPRWRSLWAMSAVDREGGDAMPILLDGLENDVPIVERNAAVALAFFSRTEATPELIRGLTDADEFRRWEAVFSLRELGSPEVQGVLIPLLAESAEPASR